MANITHTITPNADRLQGMLRENSWVSMISRLMLPIPRLQHLHHVIRNGKARASCLLLAADGSNPSKKLLVSLITSFLLLLILLLSRANTPSPPPTRRTQPAGFRRGIDSHGEQKHPEHVHGRMDEAVGQDLQATAR